MVGHANLLNNLSLFEDDRDPERPNLMVTGLPTFHDMGLIYGFLRPIYGGFPSVAMAPAAFLQKPIRWLRAISDYRATHSPSPNFGFELCTRKVSPRQDPPLDD